MTAAAPRRRRIVGAIALGAVVLITGFATCGPGQAAPPARIWIAEVPGPVARPDARVAPGGEAVDDGEALWIGGSADAGGGRVILLDRMGPVEWLRLVVRGSTVRDTRATYRRADEVRDSDGVRWRAFDRESGGP